jgi:hypothetical protein
VDAIDHNLSALVIVPPIGLGTSLLSQSLALCLACLVGMVVLDLGAGRTAKRGAVRTAIFCLLALTLVLAAVMFWNEVG